MSNLNAASAGDYVRKELVHRGHTSVDVYNVRRMIEEGHRVHYVVEGDCIVDGPEEGTEVMAFEWIVWEEPDGQIMGEML